MEVNPFPDLKISDFNFLSNLKSRNECPSCKKSRKYFCYTCYVPVKEIEQRIPNVKLPLKVDIIKHPKELDGKSTAVHAQVISPDDVTIYTYPCIPTYDPNKVVLVYPGEKSMSMDNVAIKLRRSAPALNTDDHRSFEEPIQDHGATGNMDTIHELDNTSQDDRDEQLSLKVNCYNEDVCSQDQIDKCNCSKKRTSDCPESGANLPCKKLKCIKCPFDKVVFIDSTWNQAGKIYKDERLHGLLCVELASRTTRFWRHQREKPRSYLATIEAIYYFLRDYHHMFVLADYSGQYDNLLFFFAFMHQKIRMLYDGGKHLKAYSFDGKES